MLKRIATAVVLIPVVLLLILRAPVPVLAIFAGIVALLTIHEFLKLTESYRVGERNCRGRLLPTISRADVAHFILEELENPRHIRQVVPLCY